MSEPWVAYGQWVAECHESAFYIGGEDTLPPLCTRAKPHPFRWRLGIPIAWMVAYLTKP